MALAAALAVAGVQCYHHRFRLLLMNLTGTIMRIGVFGGSFDPIHFGHLLLAEQCREQTQLDRVLFVPASISPLKQAGPQASDRQRLEMIELAIAGHKAFEVSTLEIERGETSYTVDTLMQIKQTAPDDELFLLMGQDSLQSFDLWKEPSRICELATLLIYGRPGEGRPSSVQLQILKTFTNDESFDQVEANAIDSRLIEISSSDMRQKISNGLSIRYMTPRAVEKYIETNRLYVS